MNAYRLFARGSRLRRHARYQDALAEKVKFRRSLCRESPFYRVCALLCKRNAGSAESIMSLENSRDEFSSGFDDDNGTSRP